MEPALTKRKNTVKNKPIRHFSHGCQLYASLLTASSPQIYREIIKRKPVDNRNYLDIKLLDLVKLNTIHGYRSLKYSRYTNSGGPAEKMKGGRVEGWKMREIVDCQLSIANCETRGTT